jgi:glycosyltransferase involved in cell wall biosynthesis
MTNKLHIIEPTLNNTAGHCFTVVHSLAVAARQSLPNHQLHVWSGHRFAAQQMADSDAVVHPYFHRRIRRPQLWWLLRRLARQKASVLLPTAGRSELAIYAALPQALRQQSRMWFYIHQLRMDGARAERLRLLAKRVPDVRLLCTHPSLQQTMLEAGFRRAMVQPCPFEPPTLGDVSSPFRHLIFPGEARLDKNLPFLIEVLRLMRDQKLDIPISIQAGPNHHGLFSEAITQVLGDLRGVGYPHLSMPQRAFAGDEYLQQFAGGICLQPYRVEDYAGKISGITLDALTRGCPCIAATGTWPAQVVEEFSAGAVCPELDAQAWLDAITHCIAHYDEKQQACAQAMQVLSQRHHPARTLETIRDEEDK